MAGLYFNDTTSARNGLIQDCELWTQLGDGSINGDATLLATFTRRINSNYHKIVTMILESQDSWDWDDGNNTDYPVATTPLVASQRDYTFPVSLNILKIKRVDVTYDGSTWYRADSFDSGAFNYGMGNDVSTDTHFSRAMPKYDVKGNSIWMYPLATASDVAAGAKIRIEFSRDITEFTTTSTTSSPGIDAPFHGMISCGASLDYAIATSLGNKNDLAAMWADWEARLKRYYGRKIDDVSPVIINYPTSYK